MAEQKKQVLGRGLSALLKDPATDIKSAADKNAEQIIGAVAEIDIDAISANPYQPRTNFAKEALDELAQSIAQLGVIQPITVRKTGFNQYEIISGERRWRAAQKAGLKTIPAYVRLADDQNMLEMALVENIQREDLDPIEIAISYRRLIEEINLTQEKLSERVGKKRSTVTNYIRLLKLPDLIQVGLRDKLISMGHARALINVEDEDVQIEIYKRIIAKELSVRQVEELVKRYKDTGQLDPEKKSPTHRENDEELDAIKEVLSRTLRTKVEISKKQDGKGRIIINFENNNDLERILAIVQQ
ncbi:ParB/RepB/Spo0J family partition protein [Schleiferia thermophila]|jgi:ParB family chromosome partitioning protein|uniref:ParB family chromosome partitioning protein n=1 Tax=Schleiferia thermophila TaxID=884107 RepID=A0A369A1X0_9FLAO|nr:ParB/RepB/Spo0J family partition protein [Schleiferia thermophila]KFD39190.1 chromosome partitioning protein ParB [Schleiferia thermophila str. Yellowstone]RCX03302.1 ParB family chromosome partitioning protein [Schleiferia thermophila]GCD80431.1 chromosome partitioning protein ParB [Schleiferia thermophila]